MVAISLLASYLASHMVAISLLASYMVAISLASYLAIW